LMISYFYNFAVVDYDYLVGIANGAKSMSNNYARSSLHESQKSSLDAKFSARVDATSSFVQDEYCRICKDSPRN